MYIRKIAMALAAACLLAVVPCGTAFAAEKPEYLKSVTYFGDEWPINYWNSEDKDMEKNFERIREDGFNSIILVVPWREFQPNKENEEFNQAAFDRLNEVMNCAEKYDLWVTLRIGYTWDYYETGDVRKRFSEIVSETSPERSNWMRYCKKIFETVSAHENFHSGFITWEDFWNYTENMNWNGSKKNMVVMAKECGYQEYLKEHYCLEEVSERYQETFQCFEDVYIPKRKQQAAELFFEFYDQFLIKLLAQSQEVFPGLSMEARTDADLIYLPDGSTYYYYSHEATYPCEGAEYSALMYSVSMGQKNENDTITAEQALAGIKRTLGNVNKIAGKKLYAEQLLYMDTTEAFSYNTQIEEAQVADYVQSLAPVLKENTMGYGLWAYRNYVNNCVYNGQFALNTQGWKFSGGSSVKMIDGTWMANIGAEKKISQNLSSRMVQAEQIFVKIYIKPTTEKAICRVKLGDMEETVTVDHAGVYEMSFPWSEKRNLELSGDHDMYVDDIKVYTYEQYARLYDTDGVEQDLAESFRILNGEL